MVVGCGLQTVCVNTVLASKPLTRGYTMATVNSNAVKGNKGTQGKGGKPASKPVAKPTTTGKPVANKGKQPQAASNAKPKPTKLPNGKPVPTPTSSTGYHGVPRANNLPLGKTYAAVLAALVACKATAPGTAVGSGAVVAASKGAITPTNARHYTYHGQTENWCGVVTATGGRGYLYYITAKGVAALAAYKAANK